MISRNPLAYDFEERHVEVDGIDLAYVDEGAGAGTPLLLVHGIGATLDHWALVIPHLAKTRRVVALDLPGFGRSGKPDRRYDPDTFARTIAAFAGTVGMGRMVIAGHSMGGAISAELALMFPQQVERLILVDAAGMTRMPARLMDFAVAQFEKSVDPGKVQLPPRLVRLMTKAMFYEPPPFAERNVARILAAMAEGDWPERVRSYVRSATGLSRAQIRGRLTEFELPTLIVWGEKDRVLPIRHGRQLHAGIRRSRFVPFPRTGHCPQIERPDRFVEVVEAFLQEGL